MIVTLSLVTISLAEPSSLGWFGSFRNALEEEAPNFAQRRAELANSLLKAYQDEHDTALALLRRGVVPRGNRNQYQMQNWSAATVRRVVFLAIQYAAQVKRLSSKSEECEELQHQIQQYAYRFPDGHDRNRVLAFAERMEPLGMEVRRHPHEYLFTTWPAIFQEPLNEQLISFATYELERKKEWVEFAHANNQSVTDEVRRAQRRVPAII